MTVFAVDPHAAHGLPVLKIREVLLVTASLEGSSLLPSLEASPQRLDLAHQYPKLPDLPLPLENPLHSFAQIFGLGLFLWLELLRLQVQSGRHGAR